MKKRNTTVVVVILALTIAWGFACTFAVLDYVRYKGQTVAEMIVPANIQERPIAQTVMHTNSSMQSVRSSVYTNTSQPEQHFATTEKPTYTPSNSYRVYESSSQEIHHIGGGMSMSAADKVGHATQQKATSTPNYNFTSVTIPLHTSQIHNIVAVSEEAQEAAIAQSAPARQAAAQLPPPPTVNPDQESQLGYEAPIGDEWCLLVLVLLMAIGIYRRKQQETIA